MRRKLPQRTELRARTLFAATLATLAVLAVYVAPLALAEDDWERRASDAALTERGFYESGGRPDRGVMLVPQPRQRTAIEEADRAVAAQADTRAADAARAEQAKVDAIVNRLVASREVHSNQLLDLQTLLRGLETQLGAAEAAGDKQAAATLHGQAAAVEESLGNKLAEVESYEARIQLELTKARAQTRAPEEAARLERATQAANDYYTQQARIEAGSAAFQRQLDNLATLLEGRDDAGRVALEQWQASMVETHQAWLANQRATLDTRRRELEREYAQNRNDGIGPTSLGALRSQTRGAALAAGRDPQAALDFVDHDAVARSETTAGMLAGASSKNAPPPNLVAEFAREAVRSWADATVHPIDFYTRLVTGYGVGVAEGLVDIVKDLVGLIVEIGDTAGEELERRLEQLTDRELDVFGDENLQKLRKALYTADALASDEGGAGREEARKLLATAEAVQHALLREADKLAGQGPEGVKKANRIVGRIAANLLAEGAVIEGLAAGGRLTGTGLRALTGRAGKVDDAAALAAKAGTATVGAAKLEATVAKVEAVRNATGGISGYRVTLSNGQVAVLSDANKLGQGSFTAAWRAVDADGRPLLAPDGSPLVVKLTKSGDDGLDRLGAAAFEGIDPALGGAPRVHTSGRVGEGLGDYSGGMVAVVDEAPADFRKVASGKADLPEGAVRLPDGKMSAGQAIALDRLLRALNDNGWVWFDLKSDNFAFQHLGGDEWRAIAVDTGGTLPAVGRTASERAANARKAQLTVLDPQFGPGMRLDIKMAIVSETADPLIDWQRVQTTTGQSYTTLQPQDATLGKHVPFNPELAHQQPLVTALARAETPEDLARVQTELRAAQDAAGPSTGSTSAAVDRDAPTQLDSGDVDRGAPTQLDPAETPGTRGARTATGVPACPVSVGPGHLDVVSRVFRYLSKVRSNIVPAHGEVFSAVARRRNEIILVRPVNQYSTRLISDNYATKGMGIKGKSADWGPHAGTIPVDPRLSKLGNPTGQAPTPDELRLYENYNRKALGEAFEEPITDASGNITGWKPKDPEPAIAQRVKVPGPDGKMIEVLGDRATGRPITADYDLFAVGVKGGDRSAVSSLASNPEMGAVSGNEVATAGAINDGVRSAGYSGGNVVHHGPASRFADELSPRADFPITAHTPDGNVHTINDATDLADFYATWNALGYDLPPRPGWQLDPNIKPSGKFAALPDAPIASATVLVGAAQVSDACADPATAIGDETPVTLPPEPTGPGTGTATGAGTGGGSDGTAQQVGGGYPLIPSIDPIYFAFGESTYIGGGGETFVDPGREQEDVEVVVEQVFNIFGNNPFSPLDPLGDEDRTSTRVRVPTPSGGGSNGGGGGGVSPPPSGGGGGGVSFIPGGGNYNGGGGCGILSTSASVGGVTVTLNPFGPAGSVGFSVLNPTTARSISTDVFVLGAVGHTCELRNGTSNTFEVFCFRTADPTINCSEPLSR